MNVKFISTTYEASRAIELYGNRSQIDKYLKQGYQIKEQRNGYWLLVKSVKIMVHVEDKGRVCSYDVKEQVLNHYGRTKFLCSIFEQFRKDAEKERIKFYKDSSGELTIA